MQQPGLFAQALDVQPLRDGPGLLEGKLGLDIAVGPGGAQDQGTLGGHEVALYRHSSSRELALTPVYRTDYSLDSIMSIACLTSDLRTGSSRLRSSSDNVGRASLAF